MLSFVAALLLLEFSRLKRLQDCVTSRIGPLITVFQSSTAGISISRTHAAMSMQETSLIDTPIQATPRQSTPTKATLVFLSKSRVACRRKLIQIRLTSHNHTYLDRKIINRIIVWVIGLLSILVFTYIWGSPSCHLHIYLSSLFMLTIQWKFQNHTMY